MKTLIASSLMILTLVSFGAAHADESTAKIVPMPVHDVYIPSGFDSTSDVFVVESGIFPNGCYKFDHVDVTHVNSTLHEIRSYAKVNGGMCIMVLIPFHKEVMLGKLAVGSHTLRFMNGDGTYMEQKLSIDQ